MSREKRELKRKKKKKWRVILISFIFIYLLFRSVPSLFAVAFKTTLPESQVIEDKIETEGIIIKKERMYKADGEGNIEIISNDGDRVAAGTKVAKLVLLNDTSTLNQELEELNKKIDILTKTEKDSEIVKNDEKKVEDSIDSIIQEIQTSISKEDYQEAEILKEKLSIYDGKQKDIVGKGTLISQSLDSLNEKREQVLKQISSNTIDYFSNEAGIISFKMDGYEEIYSSNHIDDYKYSDFKQINDKQKTIENNNNIKAGEFVFKIIDNFEWYMIIKIENFGDVSMYKEGDSILLTGNQIEDELTGYIKSIKKDKDKILILCKFNSDFHNYYDKRYMKINIVKSKHDSFRIPTKSIVEKDGIKGVYLKDISGIVKFKPVEILKEEDSNTYISNGDKNNNIKVKGRKEPLKTVTKFDEILLNTTNIKEGMIIN